MHYLLDLILIPHLSFIPLRFLTVLQVSPKEISDSAALQGPHWHIPDLEKGFTMLFDCLIHINSLRPKLLCSII